MVKVQARLSVAGKKFTFQPLYSGGVLYLSNFDTGLVLDIADMSELPEKVKVCFDHDDQRIVGWMRPKIVEIDGKKQIRAEGEFTENADALRILQSQKSGQVWECSIATNHFNRFKDTVYVPAKSSVSVNGRTFFSPVRILKKWPIDEGSFVKKGGDAFNQVAIHARFSLKTKGKNEMSKELKAFITSAGFNPDEVSEEAVVIWEHAFAEHLKQMQAVQNAETDGETDAEADGETDGETDAEADGEADGETDAEADGETDAEADGETDAETEEEKPSTISAAKSRAKAKAKARARAGMKAKAGLNPRAKKMKAGQVKASFARSGAPKAEDVFKAAALRNAGILTDDQVKASLKCSDAVMSEALSRHYDGLSVQELAREMARQKTGRIYHGTEDDFVAMFFGLDQAKASFSTIAPIGLLENILNIIYYESSRRVNPIIDKIAKRVRVKNFHDAKVSSYDVYGLPAEVSAEGRLPHAAIVGEDRDVPITRKGQIITFTRDDLVNNVTEGFMEIVAKFGVKQGRGRHKRGIKKLLEAVSDVEMFSTTIGNKLTTKLSVDGLNLASAALAQMETQGSDPDDPDCTEFEGKYLLVPETMAGTAADLFNSMNLVDSEAGQTISLRHRHLQYVPLSTAYLTQRYGGTDTGWFLLADPAEAAILAEARLIGAEEPHISQVPTEPGIIGRSWQTYFEYGFGILDRRAAVYSDGSAN